MKKKEHMTMQIVIIILYATLEIIESAPSSIISTSTNLKSIPSTSTNLKSIPSTSTNLKSILSTSTNLKSILSTSTNLNSTQLSNINSAINTLNSISNMVISNPNSSLPLSSTSNNQTNSTSSSRNETINVPMFQKKSSSGLSAGAICAIIIPTIAALLAVAAISALCKGATAPPVAAPFAATTLPEPHFIDTSVAKFNAVQEIPVQQPQLVKVQPIKENTQVNYPVQRVIEPPKVVSPQPAQLVPVQEVQMVPVQEVQMVPVQQVDMVPVQQVVTEVKEVQVLPTQVLPTVTS